MTEIKKEDHMNGQLHNIRVDKINSTSDPWTPASGKYTVWEWKVTGAIGGVQQDFILKTLAPTQARCVCDGWQGQAEEDERNGTMKYKIPKAAQQQQAPAQPWNQGTPPAQTTHATATAAPPSRTYSSQQSEYTLGELATLMGECVSMITDIFKVKEMSPDWRSMGPLCSTLFIEANRKGIKAGLSAGPGMNDPMKAQLIKAIEGSLAKMGLSERVGGAGVTDDELIDMWTAAEANEFTFAKNVNDKLTTMGV